MLIEINPQEANVLLGIIRIANKSNQPSAEADEQLMVSCLHFLQKIKVSAQREAAAAAAEAAKANENAPAVQKTK
jgi:hypothetical protein